MRLMDVFLTGGTGFVGRHVASCLAERGHRVRCLVRDPKRAEHLIAAGHEIVSGDLADQARLERAVADVEAVVHVAGLVRARSFADLCAVNSGGTARLAAALRSAGRPGARFLLVSSQAAGGPSSAGTQAREVDPPRPVSWYGWSKLRGEQAAHRILPASQVVIVRPPTVYGPHDRDIFEFFLTARKGIRVQLGSRRRMVSLVHAEDLARGIVAALETPVASGRTYYLAHRQAESMDALLAKIAVVVGGGRIRLRVPEPVVMGAAMLADEWCRLRGSVPKFCRDKAREFLASGWECDVSQAAADLDWTARISVDEGLRTTAAWYVDHGWL